MKLLKSIQIEHITKDYIHYVVEYVERKWWWRKEERHSLYVVHNRFHSLLHKTISGTNLNAELSYDLVEIIYAKLMLMVEQNRNEFKFPHQ